MAAHALAIVLMLALGCAGGGGLGLTSEDNNPARLAQAFSLRETPRAGVPMNALGQPLAFLVARANKKKKIPQKLIAFDLAAKRELWRVDTDVRSRVIVGREFIAHLDGEGALVGRAVATGQPLWSVPVGATDFLGASADARRVYYVTQDKTGKKQPVWYVVAVDGSSGAEQWRTSTPGLLGAPAAQGGLVYSPFLKQWLAILDARTGKQVARIRGIDEEIAFVRAVGDQVYFGSKAGVFLMDERAASGRRAESTYGQANVPKEFSRTQYHWDAFDRVQTGYSAYDRNRLLWLADGPGKGKGKGGALAFQDEQVVLLIYRFFFSFDAATGALRWAYNHPRVDVVGAAHGGPAIAFASGLGDLGALDPATGHRVYTARVDDQLIGATFDTAGWAPSEEGEPTSTVTALASIARDRDARFGEVKRFAVTALASLPGAEVTRDLVELIQNERTPPKLYEKAVEVLSARTEVAGLVHIISALSVPYDYISGTRPRAVGVLAQAIGALGKSGALDPDQRGAAVDVLLFQLTEAETPAADLVEIIKALGAVGGGAEIAPLRSFLLVYRTDPAFSSQVAPLGAAIDVLLERGAAPERELVGFVADDSRTQATVAEYARRALEQTGTPQVKEDPAAESAAPAAAGAAKAPAPDKAPPGK